MPSSYSPAQLTGRFPPVRIRHPDRNLQVDVLRERSLQSNTSTSGSNQDAQFCRQCHGGESNEMHGAPSNHLLSRLSEEGRGVNLPPFFLEPKETTMKPISQLHLPSDCHSSRRRPGRIARAHRLQVCTGSSAIDLDGRPQPGRQAGCAREWFRTHRHRPGPRRVLHLSVCAQHNGLPKEMAPQIRDGAMKMIVFEELVYQEAQRRKLTVSSAKMAQAEKDFRKQFATPKNSTPSCRASFTAQNSCFRKDSARAAD